MQKFTGLDYLKIDISSNYGLDKKTWKQRLEWFDQNESNLFSLVPTAESPALFFAAVEAYRRTKEGKPTGYMISLDATSSGLQLLACLTGDTKAAKLCNVVDTGEREDAYTGIYETMLEKVGEEGKINRDDLKQAVMTSLYGSVAMPKQVFGEGALLDIFYDTMKEVAPYAWELNEAFLAIWDDTALSNDWILPDNFHTHIKVMDKDSERFHFLNEPFDVIKNVNRPVENGRSLGANTIHSIDGMIVREMGRRCMYDPIKVNQLREVISLGSTSFGRSASSDDDKAVITLWGHYKDSGYLSARILDHLNAYNLGQVDVGTIVHLLDSLPKKPFNVIMIHQWWIPNFVNCWKPNAKI